MLDSTIKTITQVHSVWSSVKAIVAYNAEANALFTRAVVAKSAVTAIYTEGVGVWTGIPNVAFDNVLKEADKLNDEFRESASKLCDLLHEIVFEMGEVVSRELVHDVLSALLYRVVYQKWEG